MVDVTPQKAEWRGKRDWVFENIVGSGNQISLVIQCICIVVNICVNWIVWLCITEHIIISEIPFFNKPILRIHYILGPIIRR